jgi:hypothetical protein
MCGLLRSTRQSACAAFVVLPADVAKAARNRVATPVASAFGGIRSLGCDQVAGCLYPRCLPREIALRLARP